jgi:hypothetical protein
MGQSPREADSPLAGQNFPPFTDPELASSVFTTRAHNWFLSWARLFQLTPSHYDYFKMHFNIIPHSVPKYLK